VEAHEQILRTCISDSIGCPRGTIFCFCARNVVKDAAVIRRKVYFVQEHVPMLEYKRSESYVEVNVYVGLFSGGDEPRQHGVRCKASDWSSV